MYCPTCGAEAATGIRYCKRCGEVLTNDETLTPIKQIPPSTSWILGIVTIAIAIIGLMIVFITAGEVSRPDHDSALPIVMIVFGTVAVSLIVAFVLRLWYSVLGLGNKKLPESRRRKFTPDTDRNLIAGPPISGVSVTEHTTRTLEEARRRESKH